MHVCDMFEYDCCSYNLTGAENLLTQKPPIFLGAQHPGIFSAYEDFCMRSCRQSKYLVPIQFYGQSIITYEEILVLVYHLFFLLIAIQEGPKHLMLHWYPPLRVNQKSPCSLQLR